MFQFSGVFRRIFQVFPLDVAYVAMALRACFKCFILTLQAFHVDVAKVDLDVAYVAMPIHTCFKCMLVCCKYFIWMFQK
jgi:hypothetical protein